MPRLNTGCRAAGGTLSESHEPQMRTWVIGPVALQRKSLAKTLGSVARTSQPFWLVSGICSHLSATALVVGGLVGVVPVRISNARSRLVALLGRRSAFQPKVE